MIKEYQVIVEGKAYLAVFSDEMEILLAASAEGKAVIGRWDSAYPHNLSFDLPYLVEDEADLTPEFLERVVRRKLGLPWRIAETERLLLREFVPGDWPQLSRIKEGLTGECPAAFSKQAAFLAYIRHQYSFYEYGIWAIMEKQHNILLGACGIWDGDREETETGYWICPLFQRQGYGREALKAVLEYACRLGKFPVYADIREGNLPSRKLAASLGFVCLAPGCPDQEQSAARKWRYRYVPY